MNDLFNRFKTRIRSINTGAGKDKEAPPESRLQVAFESILFECQLEANWTVDSAPVSK